MGYRCCGLEAPFYSFAGGRESLERRRRFAYAAAMATIWFYQLLHLPLDAALPKMLEMSLQRGKRALVMASTAERVEALCDRLWTYRDDSFLPHGTAKDGMADHQPVWLTEKDENPNGADYLFLTDGADSELIDTVERTHEVFDGRDPEALAEARRRWRAYKNDGHDLAYFEQQEGGGWAKRA